MKNNKKPRKEYFKFSFDREVLDAPYSLRISGKDDNLNIKFLNENNEEIKPFSSNKVKAYENDRNKLRTLLNLNCPQDCLCMDNFDFLLQQDLILAIDTNVKKEYDYSSTFIAQIKPINKYQYNILFIGPQRINNNILPDVHPEKKAIIKLIDKLINRKDWNYNKRVMIITDHDLGNIDEYNSKRKPLIPNTRYFLPKNFKLHYAKADKPNESLYNSFISECDKLVNKHYSSKIMQLPAYFEVEIRKK